MGNATPLMNAARRSPENRRIRDVSSAGKPAERNFSQSLRLALGVLEHGRTKAVSTVLGWMDGSGYCPSRIDGNRFREQRQRALGRRIGLVRKLVPTRPQIEDMLRMTPPPPALMIGSECLIP